MQAPSQPQPPPRFSCKAGIERSRASVQAHPQVHGEASLWLQASGFAQLSCGCTLDSRALNTLHAEKRHRRAFLFASTAASILFASTRCGVSAARVTKVTERSSSRGVADLLECCNEQR